MIRVPPPAAPAVLPALDDLIGDLPLAVFLAEHHGVRPLLRRAVAAAWCALLEPPALARLLATPDCDVFLARAGALQPGRPRTLAEDEAAQAAGCTTVLRHIEHWLPALDRAVAALLAVLPGAPDAHLYRTPAGHSGFGWHCDAEDVFIVQIAGVKRYHLRANTTCPRPLPGRLPPASALRAETTPRARCDLAPGDCLYLPAGWWHAAEAITASTSLSLGIQAAARVDLAARCVHALGDDQTWRERLPALPGERRAAAAAALRALARHAEAVAADTAALDRLLAAPLPARPRAPITPSPPGRSAPCAPAAAAGHR